MTSTVTVRRGVGVLIVVAGLAVVPAFTGSTSYVLQQLEVVCSLVLVAIGLNVVTGFAGQLTLGPGATFAVAGYVAAVLANDFTSNVGLLFMCVAGVIAAAAVGFVVGIPSLRVGGFYLAMVTLFAALLIPTIAGNLNITGNNNGISLVSNPTFDQHPSGAWLYELGVAIVMLGILASLALLHSRLGHRFLALRTSEELAGSLGISGYRTKLAAFVVSSVPAGIGGAFYVYTQQFISPGSITTDTSIYLLASCVIGGFGTIMGPLVGGVLVLGLSEFSGGLAKYQGIIFGVLLLVFSMVLPEGLLGLRQRLPGITPALRNAFGHLGLAGLWPAGEGSSADGGGRAAADPLGLGSEVVDVPPEHRRPGAGVLRIEGASRRFGGVVAVDGVDLEVVQGQLRGLIGSNGSGKTTVLNLISGFYRLDEGRISIDGTTVASHEKEHMAHIGVARTFQTPILIDELSVLDNVVYAAEAVHHVGDLSSFLHLPPARRTDRDARLFALSCLELVGLSAVAGRRVDSLPHGLRRLVEVARALALRPRFLLLDEPAAGLSAAEMHHLRRTLISLRAANMGILLVEHNIPLVLDVCDQVTALHLGRVIAEGLPAAIVENEEVALAFLGSTGAGVGHE